ncbi:acyltransferase [Roseateles sp. DAIF2]|uniref:acyltransferase n=1 Tax=Roseateles sp. DAIF2 TaxID=2714952 RepID=UPI0018A284D5|nr:acyltransferase [Roseateles sp. DAIF2]QPF75097.1 acyltransferase [Roseateles sp. DAIF2]
MIHWILAKVKGPAYRLDPRLPSSALVEVLFRRLVWALRGVWKRLPRATAFRSVVFVGADVTLRNQGLIRIGSWSTLAKGVLIDGLSSHGVTIGRRVNIGPYTQIEATGVITNLGIGFEIGDNSGIGAFSYVGAAGGVKVGANVIMGQRVSFHSEDHVFSDLDVPIRAQGVVRKGIVVADDCWIGANVTFLDGCTVGRGCVIGAGSVVRGDIPAYSIAVGIPAKVVRSRRPQQVAAA